MDIVDRIRIEEFRQLKKENRGSERHLIVGIDIELDRYFGKWEPLSLSIVKWCLDPSVIAGMGEEQFAELIAP